MQPAPSRISAQSEKKAHYGQLWDDVADNQRHLADSELRFLLLLCRRGWAASISDNTWESSTGLHPRMKNRAVAGLRRKGLVVNGHGKGARYSFNRHEWAAYTHRNRDTEVKARTEGRKVCAKPGQQIHPMCRDRGCQRLCEEKAVIPINSIIASPNQTPMSGIAPDPPPSPPPSPPLLPLTFAAILKLYPKTTDDFPQRLKSECEAKGLRDFTDEQLAKAVFAAQRPKQHSAGLFLRYVPAALRAIMAQPEIPGTRQTVSSGSEQISAYLKKQSAALQALGFEDFATEICLLNREDLNQLDEQLANLGERVAARLKPPPDELIEAELKEAHRKMSPEQLARLRESIRRRLMIEQAGLEGFGVIYV